MVINMALNRYGRLSEDGVYTNVAVSEDPQWAEDNNYVLIEPDVRGRYASVGEHLSEGHYVQYVAPTPPATWDDIREVRDMMLADSDLLMLPDRYAALTEAQQTELEAYRQELRDIPTSVAEPEDVVFPSLSF